MNRGRPTIAFDGAILAHGPITGVAGSFLTTLRAYAARDAARCLLLVPTGTAAPALPGVDVVAGPNGRLTRQRALPRRLRQLGADLLHCPVAAVPVRGATPVIATIHDLPWRAPVRLAEAGCGPLHRLAVRLAARRAAAITVPSRATAADLLREVGDAVAPKLHCIPHGTAQPAAPAPAADLDGPFLVLGDGRPRKNLDRVRAAHARARRIAPDLPDLRFIGPGFGYLADAEVAARLRRARALVHCALHEGFGLPPLEAMAHGVPVLAAAIPSLTEVTGDAALHVDPLDVEAIAAGLVRIHRDAALRATLRQRGLQRARAHTPAAAAALWQRMHDAVLDAGRHDGGA